DAEPFELAMAVALANPEIESSTGHEVERRCLLGEEDRIVPGQHEHGGAEAKRRRARGEPSQELQRSGHLVPAPELVLDEERGAIAERLRLHVEVNEVVEPLADGGAGALADRLRAAENRELHRRILGAIATSNRAVFSVPRSDIRRSQLTG